jgi:hypothetical protein
LVYITRPDQSKIRLPDEQVEAIGSSLSELYEHRLKNRFEGDLNRIHCDIRWSLRHGLVNEAAADVLHARTLDPRNAETGQLLRQVAARLKSTHGIGEQDSSEHNLPVIQQVSHQSVAPMPRGRTDERSNDADLLGLSPPLIHQFAVRIQPILMNRCASCLAKDSENTRDFQIHTALTSKWAPKIVVSENLREVLRFVDRNNPESSPLRERATDSHGGRRHTFGNPGSSMMQNLDHWLGQLQGANPMMPMEADGESPIHLSGGVQQAGFAAVGGEAELVLPPSGTEDSWPIETSGSARASSEIPKLPESIESTRWRSQNQPDQPVSTEAARVRRMPKVDNPFDPEIFNRRFHGP